MLNRLINPVAEQIIGADAGERGENSWRIGPRLAWKARTDIVERRSIQAFGSVAYLHEPVKLVYIRYNLCAIQG